MTDSLRINGPPPRAAGGTTASAVRLLGYCDPGGDPLANRLNSLNSLNSESLIEHAAVSCCMTPLSVAIAEGKSMPEKEGQLFFLP